MHPISEKRLKLQEDKARARLYSAHAAIPEALGGTGDLPEQPAHFEPDDQATARAEARQRLAADKARARLEASGAPIEVSRDGSVWPSPADSDNELERLEEERMEDLRHEMRVRLEQASSSELSKAVEELGSIGSRLAALEARCDRLEARSRASRAVAIRDLRRRALIIRC